MIFGLLLFVAADFHGWVKDGATKADFEAAAGACNERVLQSSRGPLIEAERERAIAIFRACMRENGWRLVDTKKG